MATTTNPLSLPSPPDSPSTIKPTTSSKSKGKAYTPILSQGAFVDPFAGSAKATQSPPSYYQRHSRTLTPDCVPLAPPSQLRTPPSDSNPAPKPAALSRRVTFLPSPTLSTAADREQTLWEDALERLFRHGEKGPGKIDLSDQNITRIPESIAEASNFVKLPERKPDLERTALVSSRRQFEKTVSAPAFLSPSQRSGFSRSKTSGIGGSPFSSPSTTLTIAPSFERKQEEIHLLLSSNSISKLPSELFRLTGLTVISLRGNRLTHVPPAIASLPRLEELNLSNNQIAHLPSEMTLSKLSSLFITSNPLLHPPPGPPVPGRRIVSDLKVLRKGIRPLREICLTYLLSPISGNDWTAPSRLEETYDLPILLGNVSDALIKQLNGSLPASKRTRIPSTKGVIFQQLGSKPSTDVLLPPNLLPSAPKVEDEYDASHSARFNICPAPSHTGTSTLFVEHAEERVEWVTNLASNVTSSDLPNGLVPIVWRGCSSGCLDFLKEPNNDTTEEETVIGAVGVGFGAAEDWDEEFSLDP